MEETKTFNLTDGADDAGKAFTQGLGVDVQGGLLVRVGDGVGRGHLHGGDVGHLGGRKNSNFKKRLLKISLKWRAKVV